MKYYLFLIISGYFLISNCNIYAQKRGEFSYMIDGGYINYNYNLTNYSAEYKNGFNYEITSRLFFSVSNSISIGFGLGYQSKNYFSNYLQPKFSEKQKREYNEKHLNFIFPISYRKIKILNMGVYINNAIILSYILDYKIIDSYNIGPSDLYDNIGFSKRTGLNYRFSVDFVKSLNKKISFFVTPFWNYKFQFEGVSYYNSHEFDIYEVNNSFGLSIGVLFQ